MSSETPKGLRNAFASFSVPAFRSLIFAQVISGVGGQLQSIANAWQIYALTGSALQLGLTGVARAIPTILFSLLGGVVADRIDRRTIIILTQVSNGVFAVTLGVLSLTGQVQVWHIYLAVFLNSSLGSAAGPARRAALASVVPHEYLMNAMSLNFSANRISGIAGPSMAGILIALVGTPITYALNGAAHVISAVTLLAVHLPALPARAAGSPVKDLMEGVRFVRVRSIILVILLMDFSAMIFGSYQVLLPIIADQFDTGAVGFGLLSSATSVGSLVGSFVILSLGNYRYKGYLITGAILAYSICLIGLGVAPWFPLILLVSAGLGLCDSLQAITRSSIIQILTPDEFRGRVSSFQLMLQSSGPGFGLGLMGAVAAGVGAAPALIGGAIICAAINVAALINRKDLRSPDLAAPDEVLAKAEAQFAPSIAATR